MSVPTIAKSMDTNPDGSHARTRSPDTIVKDGDRAAEHLSNLYLLHTDLHPDKKDKLTSNPVRQGWKSFGKLFNPPSHLDLNGRIQYHKQVETAIQMMRQAASINLRRQAMREREEHLQKLYQDRMLLRKTHATIKDKIYERYMEQLDQVNEEIRQTKRRRIR